MPECRVCGEEISEEEAELYDGMCESCYESECEEEVDFPIVDEWE